MKKQILFLFASLIIIIACNKEKPVDQSDDSDSNTSSLIYHQAIPGGCALGLNSFKQNDFFEPDTVIQKINADSLFIYVGFNSSCGPDFSTTANISNDTIYMFINRNDGPFASCMCYYTYEFQFSGIQQPYFYVVSIDNWKFFYGYIDPREVDYSLP